jgi:P27 family predicted phage terminase small subunit
MAGTKGHSGRRPKPTTLKLLEGNPGKRSLNLWEPTPPVSIPPCPAHLSAEARKEWRRMGRQLAVLGLLTNIDRTALALYCQSWGRWIEAETAFRQYGLMVKSPSGFPMQSPYLAVANKSMEQMRQLLTEFGMSPASRTRLGVNPVEAEPDPLDLLRSRRA